MILREILTPMGVITKLLMNAKKTWRTAATPAMITYLSQVKSVGCRIQLVRAQATTQPTAPQVSMLSAMTASVDLAGWL